MGLKDTFTIQSVIWTLTFEWEFYLLLPLLARLPFRTLSMIVLMAAAAIAFPPAIVTMAFAAGGAAAYLTRRYDLQAWLKGRPFDVAMVLILAIVLSQFQTGHGLIQYGLGFVLFLLVVAKNDLFGLLTSRPAKVLGTVSYSIYLLHNIILNQVFFTVSARSPINSLSPLEFWVILAGTGLLVIACSAVTFRYIEYPFIVPRRLGAVATQACAAQTNRANA